MSLSPDVTSAILRLLDQPDDLWQARLDALCAAHPEQAAALRLAAEEARRGQQEIQADSAKARRQRLPDPLVGATIGPFQILERLGEGGMGSVYLAEQRAPVRRRVAFKVIKLGMDTKAVLARFDAERQALARMSHSNITKVFEAGATPDGKPYFAMEYVSGIPITEYCDRNTLAIEERLALFRQVCSGVQHAHTKGVIHRDLTPNNILVTTQDGQATVKIIDFGLARATDHRLTEMTLFTEHGVLAGTPEYMSPEQAGLDGLDIDMRTDVYTLGVLLYELVSGRLPFEPTKLRRGGYDGIRRIIREEDPPKPSTRATEVAADTATAARARRTDVRTLLKRLRGDLDWIVMKCIEKDRTRRYETVSQLSEDVQRHLANEPVLARDPGALYRLRKFARRHRGPLVATIALATALVAGLLVATAYRLEAQARTREVGHLAAVLLVEQAQREAAELLPPWPEMRGRIDRWLTDHETPSQVRLTDARAALGELLQRALPDSESDLEAARHADADFERLEQLRKQRATASRAQAARSGGDVQRPTLTAAEKMLPADQLLQLAWECVRPARRNLGDEARGLAYAEHLEATGIDAAYGRPNTLASVLAQARQTNGLVPGDAPAEPVVGPALADLDGAIAHLTATIDARRKRRFAAPEEQFRYDALRGLVQILTEFLEVDCRRMRNRSRWAEGLERLRTAREWDTAIAAIRAGNGVTAHEAYVEHPLDMPRLPGLVPIGMNPKTRLWEFYDLQTAWDQDQEVDPTKLPVPRHTDTGAISVSDATGIVFVLVPSGMATVGAQRRDPKGLNYDPDAEATESPPQEIGLAAYLIARHELTQAQWRRLTGGANPSRYPPGHPETAKRGQQITTTHPVENVSWLESRRVLATAGMDLPTEAQWEHACRGGTPTPWWTGLHRQSLKGACNLADQSATAAGIKWAAAREWPEFDDGFIAHAPVDTLRCNDFGLHHVHGNVSEWCRDAFAAYGDSPCAPGAGLRRAVTGADETVIRGGSFSRGAGIARSANRISLSTDYHDHSIGVRAVRLIAQ